MFKWLGSHSAFRFFLAGGGAPCVSLDLLRPKSRTFQPKLSCSAFGTASQCQRVIVGIASFRSQNDLGKNQSRNPSYFSCRLPVARRTIGAMSPHLFLFWWLLVRWMQSTWNAPPRSIVGLIIRRRLELGKSAQCISEKCPSYSIRKQPLLDKYSSSQMDSQFYMRDYDQCDLFSL